MDEGTLKKEVRKKIETSEKLCGYVAEEGESENRGQEPQGPPKRDQKFLKCIGNVCVCKSLRSE